jgi:CheY-like chemotaxis protein
MSFNQPERGGVLVVEDDPAVRDTLSEILGEEGFPVAVAANGQEALTYLRLNTSAVPCLILLDLMMPVMDGWQFRREQQEDTALAAIPVVIVSGLDTVAASAGDLNVATYLTKPIDIARLLEVTEQHCRAV